MSCPASWAATHVGRQLAELRMGERTLALRRRHPLEHRQVQPPQGDVGVERRRPVGVVVEQAARRPGRRAARRSPSGWRRIARASSARAPPAPDGRGCGARSTCRARSCAPIARPTISRGSTGSCVAFRRGPSADRRTRGRRRRGSSAFGLESRNRNRQIQFPGSESLRQAAELSPARLRLKWMPASPPPEAPVRRVLLVIVSPRPSSVSPALARRRRPRSRPLARPPISTASWRRRSCAATSIARR